MRPATYYFIAQAWPPRANRRSRREAPFHVASLGRRAHAPRHARPGRELPAVARRVLAVLNGSSAG